MIIVTGATGQLGAAVIADLMKRMPADRIVASVRDPAKAADLEAKGVGVRAGDFDAPEALARTFAGADQVLVVSANALGEEARRLHRGAIAAAREAGVGRVLYTSHAGARAGSPFAPADQHAATEANLAGSGLPWTSLRHGFYVESCLFMIGDALKAGELRVPEDGPVAWTSRDDLAKADAAILADAGSVDGVSPPLTASEAVTMAEIASIASDVTGREVRHVTVSDADWREAKIAAGMPERYADMLLGTFRAARRGDFTTTDPTLERLIGPTPRTMRQTLETVLAP